MYPYRASSETLILNVTTNLFHYQFKPLENQLGISTKQSFSHRLAKHGISAIKPSTLKSISHPAESTRPTDSSCKLLARTDVLGCDAIWWNRAAVCNGHLGRCHMITTLRGNRGEWDCWTEKVKAQSGKSWENWRRRRNRGNMRRGRGGKGPRAKRCGNTEKQQGGQWVDTCRETSWQAATWGNASALGGYPPSHPATQPPCQAPETPPPLCYPAESKWYSFMHVPGIRDNVLGTHTNASLLLPCKLKRIYLHLLLMPEKCPKWKPNFVYMEIQFVYRIIVLLYFVDGKQVCCIVGGSRGKVWQFIWHF